MVAEPIEFPSEDQGDPWRQVLARVRRDLRAAENECQVWDGARSKAGYGLVRISSVDPAKPVSVHRLVWQMANGPIPDGLNVLHRCDNPPCANLDHLFLGAHADNVADKMAKGRHRDGHLYGDDHPSRKHPERVLRGERHGASRLTETDVRSIRTWHGTGSTQEALAKRFGVARSTISAIVTRRIWAWL